MIAWGGGSGDFEGHMVFGEGKGREKGAKESKLPSNGQLEGIIRIL